MDAWFANMHVIYWTHLSNYIWKLSIIKFCEKLLIQTRNPRITDPPGSQDLKTVFPSVSSKTPWRQINFALKMYCSDFLCIVMVEMNWMNKGYMKVVIVLLWYISQSHWCISNNWISWSDKYYNIKSFSMHNQ